ncbi:DNA replication protein [Elasticomyces elasticus]|nr:DNA replication protein [Elasticomyces elasticus]KAK3631810.1 DNA replication protein [Elasticomyces elasticus]KAK4909666.1 DNA replication protein [Elasticomyces elasticus]KAK5749528.1 DNA replication protein [Elasticomyces elasticus]
MASYTSPTLLLTTAQKIPTTLSLTHPSLSPLNANTPPVPGSKLDLPLWLAEMLAVSKPAGPESEALATVDMPQALGGRVMNALRAGGGSVELRGQAMAWYGLAASMLELFEDEEVATVVCDTFKTRALLISDRAQNTKTAQQQGGDGSDFMGGLDETERARNDPPSPSPPPLPRIPNRHPPNCTPRITTS